MSESFTAKQVAEHKDVDKGLYIIIDGGVYALESFVEEHPGGAKILKRVGGKDASKQFWKVCYGQPVGHRAGTDWIAVPQAQGRHTKRGSEAVSWSTDRQYDISKDAAAAWHISLQTQRRPTYEQDSGGWYREGSLSAYA
jgi:cytochrome b involved in lipid metabolism